MHCKAIIFDLDGTLLNTLGDLTDAVNHALAQRNHPTHTQQAVRGFVGNGVEQLMTRALPQQHSHQVQACLADFRTYYDAHGLEKTVPYDGIMDMLDALHEKNITLSVLSNKYQLAVQQLVQHFFGARFQAVLGERAQVPRKPDPTAVHELLATMQVAKEHTLYVGDSGVDMRTAKNAGLYAVGVTWGFCTREELLEHGADHLLAHPSELLTWLQA